MDSYKPGIAQTGRAERIDRNTGLGRLAGRDATHGGQCTTATRSNEGQVGPVMRDFSHYLF